MTRFAGFYRAPNGSFSGGDTDNWAQSIVRNLSRKEDTVETLEADGLFLATITLPVFAENCQLKSPTAVACLVGHPHSLARGASRVEELKHITSYLTDQDDSVFRQCRGTFSFVGLNRGSQELTLTTDAFGARPIYYFYSHDHIFFSTSLRVLESLTVFPRERDLQGIAETLCFDYPLARRTVYSRVSLMRGGEILRYGQGEATSRRYFRWDRIPEDNAPTTTLCQRAYDAFVEATALRIPANEEGITALLSGGLDSRVIVCVLKELTSRLQTITFETRGRVDDYYARRYAEQIGVDHAMIPFRSTQPVMKALQEARDRGELAYGNSLVFSGDGGSVGVGQVYVQEEQVRLFRAGNIERAALSLRASEIPIRPFRRGFGESLNNLINDGIRQELLEYEAEDPGKHAHVFFMENDQRRHLHDFYEQQDLHRVEYALPFLDTRFIRTVMSVPTDVLLQHRFYHDWLKYFPADCVSVPWQTYPGHLKCPIVGILQEPKADQWQRGRKDLFEFGSPHAYWRRFLRTSDSPIRPSRLLVPALLHTFRLRPYGYLFRCHDKFTELWRDTLPSPSL